VAITGLLPAANNPEQPLRAGQEPPAWDWPISTPDQQGLERTFDWTLHGLGRLYPGNPADYRPTDALVPYYWWVLNERGRTVDATFQMDWIQRTAGFSEGRQFGPEWFKHEVGSRTTVLGVPGTEVYYGDGPVTSGEPYCFFDGSPERPAPSRGAPAGHGRDHEGAEAALPSLVHAADHRRR
jgi:hypothetical protein